MDPRPIAAKPRTVTHGAASVHLFEGGACKVRMAGTAGDGDVASWLLPIFDEVHAVARDAAASEAVLDLRGLEYANASMWKCVVAWLRTMHEDKTSSYVLRVEASRAARWQQMGLPMLKAFGRGRLQLQGLNGPLTGK